MGRISKEETAKKQGYAKSLYVKGIDIETIADIISMAVSTVRKWSVQGDWEQARTSSMIAMSELRKTILDSFISLKNGEKPLIKPDEAAKYAAAFEKLSDKKKVLSYMFDAYDNLTDALTIDVQNAKGEKAKEAALNVLKVVRQKTDRILTQLTTETLDN